MKVIAVDNRPKHWASEFRVNVIEGYEIEVGTRWRMGAFEYTLLETITDDDGDCWFLFDRPIETEILAGTLLVQVGVEPCPFVYNT